MKLIYSRLTLQLTFARLINEVSKLYSIRLSEIKNFSSVDLQRFTFKTKPKKLFNHSIIMETNIRTAKKQYDLSAIGELFKDCITPEQLREELIELVFDYAQSVEDGATDLFKSHMSTLYVLCNTLQDVKELDAQS